MSCRALELRLVCFGVVIVDNRGFICCFADFFVSCLTHKLQHYRLISLSISLFLSFSLFAFNFELQLKIQPLLSISSSSSIRLVYLHALHRDYFHHSIALSLH